MDDRVSSAADDRLRDAIGAMLKDGLKTEIWPRAETSAMVSDIVLRLHNEAGDDLTKKLVIGGFSDYTVETEAIEQPCATCMYYLVHRKFCALPELSLPVEPEWSCRLWRI